MADLFVDPQASKAPSAENIAKQCRQCDIPENVEKAAIAFIKRLYDAKKMPLPFLNADERDLSKVISFLWQTETKQDEVLFYESDGIVVFRVVTSKGSFKSTVKDTDWITTLLHVLLITGETMPPVVIVERL